jgi:hypothetical protein
MTGFLPIVVLVLASAGTLAAFGGKTWVEGTEPVLKRITLRGWLSVVFLALGLMAGGLKELYTQHKDYKKDEDTANAAKQAKQDADQRQNELKTQLSVTQSLLAGARGQLDALKKANEAIEGRLDDSKVTINDVRKNLGAARDDLTRQTTSDLVNALANSNRRVESIIVMLPLTAKAQRSDSIRTTFLPSFGSEAACHDLMGLEVGASLQHDKYEKLFIDPGDEEDEHEKFFHEKIPKADDLDRRVWREKDLPLALQVMRQDIDQKTYNGYIYTFEMRPPENEIPAAELFTEITKPNGAPFYVAAYWPPNFPTAEAVRLYSQKYPEILGKVFFEERDSRYTSGYQILSLGNFTYKPTTCIDKLRAYLSGAFDKAVLVVKLVGDRTENIVFKLHASPPLHTESDVLDPIVRTDMWRVDFRVDSVPAFDFGSWDIHIEGLHWP